MNDGFKQRLVGAIVLVCIGLILWPVIFTDATGPKLDRSSEIPPMPEFDTYEVPEPRRPADIAPVTERVAPSAPPPEQQAEETAEQTAEPEPQPKPEPEPEPEAKGPGLDSRGLPRGWVLQVASFSQADNASALKQKLQEMGYKAYTRSVTTDQGESVRVYIGPRMSEQAFADDRQAIDSKFNVKSMVVPFEP